MRDEKKTKEQLRNELTEMRQRILELEAHEERFQDILKNALEWFWEIDRDGKYTYASPVVERILGFAPEEMLRKHFFDLFYPGDREELKTEAFMYLNQKKPFREFIRRNVHKDGRIVWLSTSGAPIVDEEGNLLGFRGAEADITGLKQMEGKLQLLSLSDDLTGLHNRRGFITLAKQQLKIAKRLKAGTLVLVVDVDNLKVINNTFGHYEGDMVLKETASLLMESFREGDIIARVGGDEFAILLIESTDIDPGLPIVRLHESIKEHNEQRERKYDLSVSVGIAYCDPNSPHSIDDLIIQAYRVMYDQRSKK